MKNKTDITASREYRSLEIPGVELIRSRKYLGAGGWVKEQADMVELTNFLGYRFDARNIYSIWSPKGVIRGGHLEGRSKIVSFVSGAAFMVMVDMRPGEGQGKVVGVYVGNHEEAWADTVFVPEGILNAYVPLNDECFYIGVSNRPFNRFDSLMTLDLFDPELGIKWPVGTKPQSNKEEKEILSLKEFIARI